MTEILILCPFCRKENRIGHPLIHRHGSGGRLSWRIEHKSPHCHFENFPRHQYNGFNIHITDATYGSAQE